MNWNEVKDVEDDEFGVDVVGESDRLVGKTYGAVSRVLSGAFWPSMGKRLIYGISDDVNVGDPVNPGEWDEWLLVGAPESPPDDTLVPRVDGQGVSRGAPWME